VNKIVRHKFLIHGASKTYINVMVFYEELYFCSVISICNTENIEQHMVRQLPSAQPCFNLKTKFTVDFD
jgi:hypothetical protein